MSIISIGKFGGNGFTKIGIYWFLAFIIGLGACVAVVTYKHMEKYALKIFSPKKFTLGYILGIIVYFVQSFILCIPMSYTKNIISINVQAINSMINEDILLTNVKYEDYITYENGDGKDLNMILIFAESISAVDSYHLGGKDNMPYLDKIQNDGITFTNFVANGTNSASAHVSTLIGAVPARTAYNYTFEEGLATFLNKQGYKTTFISAASLGFLHQKEFLEKVGFQKIIGEGAFEDKEKYSFNAAPDEYLYEKVLDEIENQTGKYFIGLQTISFHSPYDSPYCTPDGDHMYQTLKYADEKLFDFYTKLQKIGFFDNGILVILGDHRKPSPAELGESYIFGDTRRYRSVATVIGSGIQANSVNNNIVQHTDFYHSIRKLLGHGNIPIDMFYNDVFSQSENRNRGIMSDAFAILKKNKLYKLNVSDIKEGYGEIYDYYLAIKKQYLMKDIISKDLD